MRESARPSDQEYLLHHLDHTIYRFLPARRPPPAGELDPLDDAILRFVRAHPAATATQVWRELPEAAGRPYHDARGRLVTLLDRKLLKIGGVAALEEVDPRYERVPACDLCGRAADTDRIVFWKHNTPVVRCAGCGLLYTNPRWKAEHLFGRYNAAYWEHYIETVRHTAFDPAANARRWNPFIDALEVIGGPGRVLDVGSATGEFLAAARARGWAAYGVETAPVAAEYAARTHGVEVYVGALDSVPWPDGAFDAVTLWDVIEHVPSPRAYIERAARLLRPGGMLGLTTPNIHSLNYLLLGPAWEVIGPNEHLHYFSARTLERLLRRAGFAIHALSTMHVQRALWERRLGRLRPLAPLLDTLTRPVAARLLRGEELVVMARRL
jgi:SAM-dependent methyltransferase